MTTAYVITHTEATHHVEQRVGGWHDSELTSAGHRQAQAIASALRERVRDQPRVFSSDLKRAAQTAAAIGEAFATPVHHAHDLREASCGIAEGRPKAWLEERIVLPPLDGTRLDHRICEGAETRRETGARVYRFVDEMLIETPQTTIIVTHGFAMSFVVFAWLGLPLEALGYARLPAQSGSITTLARNDWGDRDLVRLNEMVHTDD